MGSMLSTALSNLTAFLMIGLSLSLSLSILFRCRSIPGLCVFFLSFFCYYFVAKSAVLFLWLAVCDGEDGCRRRHENGWGFRRNGTGKLPSIVSIYGFRWYSIIRCNRIDWFFFFFFFLWVENGHYLRTDRGVADEDQRVPAAQSDFARQNGGRQRW